MGKIIMLDDIYPYEIPDIPRDEKKILYYDQQKEDQYWRRPPPINLKKLDVRARNAYIEQERERILEGVWVFINGEPTWISPMHYDFLMYANLSDFEGPAAYYDSQRLDFYFWDFVDKDPNCYGEMTIKPRRYGYTAMNTTRVLHYAIRDFNQNIGMISTDLNKVKESIFRPTVDSLMSRPAFLRPEIYAPNSRIPQQEIRLRSMLMNQDDEEESLLLENDMGLRSWISPRSTTPKTFDGHKWHLLLMDEIWKWDAKTSPSNTWNISKETLQVGGRIVGKAALFASMGDDDGCDEAVADGIKMWGESNYQQRNRFGQTTSGLYRKFIPADVAYAKFMNKFGQCDRALAKEFILEQRSHLEEGTKEYLYHVRKYPLNIDEALGSAQNSGIFNPLRLSTRLAQIQVLPPSKKGYVRGMFHWNPGAEQVVFEPKADGFWKVAIQHKPEALNRWEWKRGLRVPPPNPEGVIGNDPVRTADNSSGHLSNNAAYAFQKWDYFGNGSQNRLIAQLYGRDEDVNLFNEQIRLGALFWGYPVMTERQITSTFDWFCNKGMESWLLRSPFDQMRGIYTDTKAIKGAIERSQAFLKKPKDVKDFDWLQTVVFEEWLMHHKDFSLGKSTKFDAFMGWMMTLYGMDAIPYVIVSPERTQAKKRLQNAIYPKRA